MSQDSAIEWTDKVWNPVRGCTKVSPGCANCYAETFAERWRGVKGHPYEQGFDLRLVPEKLIEPLRWRPGIKVPCEQCMGSGSKNDAVSCGDCGGKGFTVRPKRIFVNSMSDLFQAGVPDEFIDQVFAVMALSPRHTFQILTKRPDRMRSYLAAGQFRDVKVADASKRLHATVCPFALPSEAVFDARRVAFNQPWQINAWPLPNVWLGVSVENQHFADERIPLLLQTPAAVRFVSCEPLLERIDLSAFLWTIPGARLNRLHWIIVGGESGHDARPFNVEWARWLVAQGRSSGVPVFVKQLGAKPFEPYSDGTPFVDLHLKSKKGGDMDEWPAELRVREFPQVVGGRG